MPQYGILNPHRATDPPQCSIWSFTLSSKRVAVKNVEYLFEEWVVDGGEKECLTWECIYRSTENFRQLQAIRISRRRNGTVR